MRGIGGITVLAAVAAMLASSGCGGGDARRTARTPSGARAATIDAPGTTATTSAALVTSSSSTIAKSSAATTTSTATAVMRLATERCDRAATCKHVGTGRSFGDRDECVNAVGHAVVTALSDEECPSGVDADRLGACVSEVQSNPCEDDANSAASLPSSCTRESLCQRMDVAAQSVQTVR